MEFSELEALQNAYFEAFGDNYVISITDDISIEEIAAGIQKCISTNTPQDINMYDPNCDY